MQKIATNRRRFAPFVAASVVVFFLGERVFLCASDGVAISSGESADIAPRPDALWFGVGEPIGWTGGADVEDFARDFDASEVFGDGGATRLERGVWSGRNAKKTTSFRADRRKRGVWSDFQTVSTATIRGTNLSDFEIDPFRGRFFGYVDGAWGTQYKQSDRTFEGGFNVGAFGGGLGQDWLLGSNVIGGYGFQGRKVDIDPSTETFDAKVDSFAGFLHTSVFGPLWRLDLSFGAAKNWNEQSFPDSKNKFSSIQWNYEMEFGVRFDKGYTRIEPFANLRVLTLQEPENAERYLASPSVRTSDFSDSTYRLKLGSRFSWEYATRFSTLKPFLVAGWAREFGSRSIYAIGENSPFPVAYRFGKHRAPRDRLDLGGGVDAALRDSVDLFFQYDVEIATNYVDYLFFAGFNKKY